MDIDLFGNTKADIAIDLLRKYEPPEGYYFADSGGLDSCVCRDILIRSGVKYDAHFAVDMSPPELHRFIKEYHPETKRIMPKKGLAKGIIYHGFPPSRNIRYC